MVQNRMRICLKLSDEMTFLCLISAARKTARWKRFVVRPIVFILPSGIVMGGGLLLQKKLGNYTVSYFLPWRTIFVLSSRSFLNLACIAKRELARSILFLLLDYLWSCILLQMARSAIWSFSPVDGGVDVFRIS